MHYQWDVVWFGVLTVLTVAIGQFTPPMAVNLMVASKIAQVRMEATTRWVLWLVLAMTVAMLTGVGSGRRLRCGCHAQAWVFDHPVFVKR